VSADPLPDLQELFAQAEELHGEERARFLAKLAGRSPELAAELRDLLAAAERESPWLNTPAWRVSEPFPLPPTIGPYRVIAEVGRGGAGRVFLTEETGAGFVRRVAVKVLAGPLPTADAITRFRTEGRLLAGLEHPGIARLYDAGTTEDGAPYLAMEFIDGVDILRFANDQALGTRERIELFLQVLDAVQFAHRNLIVHRDLKPANLWVDAAGRVKLLDFGIAKLLLDEAELDSTLTRTGHRWLTPAYAAPEHIRGERTTTAADLYSLGVVLYELLTGRRPHEAAGAGLEAAVVAVDPSPPSRVVTAAACEAASAAPARELAGDLDAIVLVALRKEPEARYGSAEAFADDLRRHLEGFPVLARQGTRRYRWGKFVRRNRRSLIAAAAVFLALALGLGSALWQARRAQQAQAVAERRFDDLQGLAKAMIFEVTAAIEPLDGSGPAMELTLDRALEYLDRLRAEGDEGLLEDLAAGYERVGALAATLPVFGRGTGRWEKGLGALDQALGLRRRLVAAPGAQPDARLRLGRTLVLYCGALRAGRDTARAEGTCSEAVTTLDAAVATMPDDPAARFELATALTQKLFVAGTLGGAAAAARSPELERTAALWFALGAEPPEALRGRHDFPWGLCATSYWLRLAGRPADALQLAEWALAATAAPLTPVIPAPGAIRPVDRATALEAVAVALWDLGQSAPALDHFERAFALSLTLRRQDLRQQEQIRLFNLVGQMARLSGEVGDVERGEKALAHGARLIAEATWWQPDTAVWSRGLLARDRGHLFRAAREAPGLSAATRRDYAARARVAYREAATTFESLVRDGADPFGVAGAAAECRQAAAAL
jgi:eukaryotic-like serine/threonine-protein kinase